MKIKVNGSIADGAAPGAGIYRIEGHMITLLQAKDQIYAVKQSTQSATNANQSTISKHKLHK